MLPKQYRLPKEKFQQIYKKGFKLRGKYGMLVVLKDESLSNPKFGMVVSKKIGNAVRRHKMTRLIRNIFTSTVKENKLEKTPLFLEYIAFEYCEEYKLLEKEFGKQILEAFSK